MESETKAGSPRKASGDPQLTRRECSDRILTPSSHLWKPGTGAQCQAGRTQGGRGLKQSRNARRKGDSDVPFRILSTATHLC